MIKATDLKAGATFLFQEKPYRVIKYELVKIGRGGAVVRLSAKDLLSAGVSEKTFSSNAVLPEVNTFKKKLRYLYKDAKNAVFMDQANFEQIEVALASLGEEASYIKEGEEVVVSFWEDRLLSLELPPKVVLGVAETGPGVKGNSTTNIYKSAILENGLKLKVPLFIDVGDKILVDTRSGEYVERVKL